MWACARVCACVSTCTGRDNLQESVLCVFPPGLGLQYSGLATSPWELRFLKSADVAVAVCHLICTENVHCTDGEWQVFLRAVGLVCISSWASVRENALLKPFLPSGQSRFSHSSLSVLRPLFLPLDWPSLQPPAALPYYSLGLFLPAKRSLLPILFRVPSSHSTLFPFTGEGRSLRLRTVGSCLF